MVEPSVIVALVGTLGVIVVALINRDKDTREIKEELEAMEILLQNEKRENEFLRDILAAKEIHINELIAQLKRHAGSIQPAAYRPPDDGVET